MTDLFTYFLHRLKINHDSRDFILEICTVANKYFKEVPYIKGLFCIFSSCSHFFSPWLVLKEYSEVEFLALKYLTCDVYQED
jgi:hypothetical protein